LGSGVFVLEGSFASPVDPFQDWLLYWRLRVRLWGRPLAGYWKQSQCSCQSSTKDRSSPGEEASLVAYKSAPHKHSYGCEFPDFPNRAKGVSMG